MTVVLVGVGADKDHVRPALQLTETGKFDYIPIPETHPTSETKTYGTWELRNRNQTADQYIERISPRGDDNWITDLDQIAEHHPHHDPNFKAMTYADRRGGGGKGATLANNLEAGDILGFYTGIKSGPKDERFNRYLYGFMTVEGVHDFSSLEGEEYYEALSNFPENAHAKRLEGAGEPKHDDLVLLDGQKPAQLMDEPILMSERIDSPPWYQVTQRFADNFCLQSGRKGICRKFPLILDLSGDEFVEKVDEEQK